MPKRKNDIIAVLDMGSTKVVCFIAHYNNEGVPEVIGIGHQVSQGIKSGMITDIKLAEQSIRAAVAAAEHMAGVNIDKVVVNISGSKLAVHRINVEMKLGGQEITSRDITHMMTQGYEEFRSTDSEIVHGIPIDFTIDQIPGVKDPVGMYGDKVAASILVVTVATVCLYNIANCLARCHLDIEDYIISPYAAALGCLTEDEKELGTTIIDFGGSNTSIAVFREGSLIHTDTLPVGAMHITNDIAVGLSTTTTSAERIKTLYGNVFHASQNEQEWIDVPQIGEDGDTEAHHVTKDKLVKIIHPRVAEMVEMVKQKLDDAGMGHASSHIKITGGGSQLSGLKEYVQSVFEKPVHLGHPNPIEGMAESTKGPAFSTIVGMVKFVRESHEKYEQSRANNPLSFKYVFAFFTRWFKENF